MIAGLGTDVVNIGRIRKLSQHTVESIFHRDELEKLSEFGDSEARCMYLAGRFAAKEAFVKALGTGFGEIQPRMIRTMNDRMGKPVLDVPGRKLPYSVYVSISHDEPCAVATVILEVPDGQK